MKIGAWLDKKGRAEFTVWAPLARKAELCLLSCENNIIPMNQCDGGYWRTEIEGIAAGSKYMFIIDGKQARPDPASFYQPLGVHGPSEVFDHHVFKWDDDEWKGIDKSQMIIYELHTGTFTPEGSFESAISKLEHLVELGINTVEIMPVAQFPGKRNWGYDGAYLFGVQNSYGGPKGLKRFVNACHSKGLAVILDVVYNHLGPEGNYLENFGPYFTAKYQTPWGKAINYDDEHCDGVRNFVVQNIVFWYKYFHIDALRLDAIHGIFDMSAKHILWELEEEKERLSKEISGRRIYLIAESDLNDPRTIAPIDKGGYGIDAQWHDDYHHCIHTLLTGENTGYYSDFGGMEELLKAVTEGFVFSGEYSGFRKRKHGGISKEFSGEKFVVFSQNHDQVGNRLMGERLSVLVDWESLKLAAGSILLSPYIPLLFMGEEYGEDSPFLYFIDHGDMELVEAVRNGRKKEFESFSWDKEIPDPQSEKTFNNSTLKWKKASVGKNKVLLDLYKKLIKIKKNFIGTRNNKKNCFSAHIVDGSKVLVVSYKSHNESTLVIMNFGIDSAVFKAKLPGKKWEIILESSDTVWCGPGRSMPDVIESGRECIAKGRSFVVYKLKEI